MSARVATAGRSGIPHVVPVCHVLTGGRLYFGSGDDGRKVKNVRENPWVTLTVDVYSDHWGTLRGVMIQGRATLIERGPRFKRIRAQLYRKYPQYPRDAALSESDSVIIEVDADWRVLLGPRLEGIAAVPAEPTPAPASRLAYLDGLRGFALVFMVVNHGPRLDRRQDDLPSLHAHLRHAHAVRAHVPVPGRLLPAPVVAGRPGQAESFGVLARRFVPRGIRIILAGLLLNVLVFRDLPILAGGVFQTIGLAIIAMVPAIWLLRYPGARWVLLAVAVAGYAAFAWSFPWLESFVEPPSRVGLVLFYDFPPWPWLSLVLIGLVMGTHWLAAHRRSEAEGARFLARGAIAGALMLVAFVTWDWWAQTPTRLGMKRDFILNHHWTPRGPSLLWVFGTLWLTLGAVLLGDAATALAARRGSSSSARRRSSSTSSTRSWSSRSSASGWAGASTTGRASISPTPCSSWCCWRSAGRGSGPSASCPAPRCVVVRRRRARARLRPSGRASRVVVG